MIETRRLILRPWRESDLPAFAEQNADPAVMRFLTGALSREESDA
jgi:ribosomal-protein-alanine N-acetyltransferase